MPKKYKRWLKRLFLLCFILFIAWYVQCLPKVLFNDPTSTVVLDRNRELLGAKIAADGQWRFQQGDSVPYKFETCIMQFEDRNFYGHIGISFKGIGRSIVKNIEKGRVVSGGSTITMQLARIMKKNPKRTWLEKIREMLIATRMEMRYSKEEILGYYAANAPFGNNVVGLEAASWRYFGRSADQLSWSESATLAVLPNAPGLIYPGRNHKRLLEKRNRLLQRLRNINVLDETAYQLAINEPLPDKPLPLPQLAQHLLNRLVKEGYTGKTITTTIDRNLQEKAMEIVAQHNLQMRENRIFNAAALITSVKTGEILAYVGNVDDEAHGGDVDCIVARRSTGSILKPFLYAGALQDGLVTPKSLLPDIPSHFGSFSPKNFSKGYDGAVTADQALSRSLNIPFVKMLNEYGLEKFHNNLKKMGMTTLEKPARHYGLSLILGGAEARLWDLNAMYTSMAIELTGIKNNGVSLVRNGVRQKRNMVPDKACIYSTFEAMAEVNRPDEDGNWRAFSGSQKIAWKTGTSFGFRDAWAIGTTTDYTVSVWVGNADGEGRPGLTGIKAAAPLMFNLFGQLPKAKGWFGKPYADMSRARICSASGYRAGDLCEDSYVTEIPQSCLQTKVCPYHQLVHLDKSGKKRVDSECENPFNIKNVSWFVLPPAIEKYYKFNHPDYKLLPEFKKECLSKVSDKAMALLYPRPNSIIYVPVEIDGNTGRTVFEATHRNAGARIYWHLDDEYLGETTEIHQLSLNPLVGKHILLLVDENGISQQVKFEVEGKEEN